MQYDGACGSGGGDGGRGVGVTGSPLSLFLSPLSPHSLSLFAGTRGSPAVRTRLQRRNGVLGGGGGAGGGEGIRGGGGGGTGGREGRGDGLTVGAGELDSALVDLDSGEDATVLEDLLEGLPSGGLLVEGLLQQDDAAEVLEYARGAEEELPDGAPLGLGSRR